MMLKSKTHFNINQFHMNNRTHIMGILNVTPDSFSDGGSYMALNNAVQHAIQMEAEGAAIIDVGGESTRPGHIPVTQTEEIDRVVPIIEAVSAKVDTPISIDTYKAETARCALEAGASIINDVWGAKRDPEIAAVAAEYDVPIILMHNRMTKQYDSLIDDMKRDLHESIEVAVKAGVPKAHIVLDPGIGFAKTQADNLVVLNNLEQITGMGFPVLLGTSRKGFIGTIVDQEVPEARDVGTGATTCLGISKGVQIVRVHNVKLHVELAKMMDAMLAADKL
ncbi:dihydropteroate synthase [Lentibacillus saliphilus]|uniref:dihydropteroate synthase n=1 Tax=Lentibacillus saliphilus TaxID=2737028 RepID=UPI001C2F3FDA|nr:dihydropteroate synthase [Lentibacillus saliphilus]